MSWHRLLAGLGALGGIGGVLYLALTFAVVEHPDYGGTYVEGVAGLPIAANPLFASFNDPDRDLASLVFNGLTRLSPAGEVLPDLAERWEISEDGRRYLFHLRSDVRWHDGSPFTAEDVVVTLRAYRDPTISGNPDVAELWQKVSLVALDPFTVEATLEAPFAPFLRYCSQGILPASYLRSLLNPEAKASALPAFPPGTGPYRFVGALIDRVILEAKPNYHRGRPYISRLELRFYPDEPTALQALLRREIHGLLLRPGADPHDLAQLSENEQWRLYVAPRSSYTILLLNLNFSPFQDRRVRQALLLGLDRERLLAEVVGGQGVLADGPIPPGSWASNGPSASYPYDPERARTMLEEAGWSPGPDGVLQRGKELLRFSLITNDDPLRIRTAEAIARQWRRIGVQAELSAAGSLGLIEDFLAPRRFQVVLFGLDAGSDPDAYPFWHSSQRTRDGLNFTSFADARADTLLEEARTTPDEERRRQLYKQFQQLFAEELPGLPLYYPLYSYVLAPGVQGVQLGVLFEPSGRFSNIEQWFLRTKRAWFEQRRP